MSAEICNMALSHLGVSTEIKNLTTEKSLEAQAARTYFDATRLSLLRSFAWPFATKVGALALHTSNPLQEYGFAYVEPQDCARFLRISNGLRLDILAARIPFRIVGGPGKFRLILTDQEQAAGEWIENITDPTRFSIDFTMALSYRLASAMAPRVTKGDPTKLMDRLWQMAQIYIAQAEAAALNENQSDQDELSAYSRSRF